MTVKGPIVPSLVRRLIMHKDYVVEMVKLIIKEMNLDLYSEQTSEELGAFGLYDLSRVRSCLVIVLCTFSSFFSWWMF